jgi:hypothetical protein
MHHTRKSASLYNVREASVFKLSRLRVPRYRHFMQTVSFAIVQDPFFDTSDSLALMSLYGGVDSEVSNLNSTRDADVILGAGLYAG